MGEAEALDQILIDVECPYCHSELKIMTFLKEGYSVFACKSCKKPSVIKSQYNYKVLKVEGMNNERE